MARIRRRKDRCSSLVKSTDNGRCAPTAFQIARPTAVTTVSNLRPRKMGLGINDETTFARLDTPMFRRLESAGIGRLGDATTNALTAYDDDPLRRRPRIISSPSVARQDWAPSKSSHFVPFFPIFRGRRIERSPDGLLSRPLARRSPLPEFSFATRRGSGDLGSMAAS